MKKSSDVDELIENAVLQERCKNKLFMDRIEQQHKMQSNISVSLQEERASLCQQLDKMGFIIVDGKICSKNYTGKHKPIVTMKHMTMGDGSDGWYMDHPEFYCDIEKTDEGDWSIFFKDKNGKEAYGEKQNG